MTAQFTLPVISLLSILGLTLCYSRLFKITFEIAIFLTVAFITCVLYLASLYEVINLVSKLLICIGLGLFTIFIGSIFFEKSQHSFIKSELRSIFFYIILIALLWLRLSSQKFILWDDFSHWGLASKDLYFTDALPLLGGVVHFLDYPPAGSLFNYFVLSIPDNLGLQQQKTFSEGAALFAQSIVIVSALFPAIGYAFRKKRVLIGLIISSTLLLSLFAFGFTPATLMIDLVVAAYFGGAVAAYITLERSLSSVILLIPVLICLVLLKSVGLFLSSLVMMIIALDQVYIQYIRHKTEVNQSSSWKELIISLALLICLPLAIINVNLSWKHHVNELGAQTTFKTKVTASDIKRALLGPSGEKELKVKSAFAKQFKPLIIEYPPGATQIRLQNVALTLLLLAMLSVFIFRQRIVKNRLQETITLSILCGGFLVYSFGLLLLYFFSFGEYEAVRLASFDRYLGIYLLGWLMGLLAILLTSNIQNLKLLSVILGISLLLGGGRALYFIQGSEYDVVPKFTNSMESLIDQAKVPRNSNTKIFFISQCDTGFDQVIFKNVVYPTQVSPPPYSLGQPCGPDDIWTAPWTIAQLSEQLKIGYQYVVIAKANPMFWNQFSSLFDVIPSSTPSIFKVDSSSGKLIYVLSN